MPNGVEPEGSFFDLSSLAEQTGDFAEFYLGGGWVQETARAVASGFRGECMSVQLPGIPFAEQIAQAGDWWAEQFVGAFGGAATNARRLNDCTIEGFRDLVGLDPVAICTDDHKVELAKYRGAPKRGFQVQVPNWQDIFQYDFGSVLNDQSAEQKRKDYVQAMLRSPTPPNMREVGEILTTLDDLQDEASTLAVVLMIAEKMAGRAIPGVGWVATAADALNVISALAIPATGSGLPGKRGKRAAVEKGKHTSNGYAARVEDLRTTSKLKIGVGDILQGLQATDSAFGFGVQLGPIMGFLQDAFWLGVRGGELKARGPAWDPLGFTEAGRSACYRSPSLDQVHPSSYYVLANEALSLWSKAGRVLPFIDLLGEHALASSLVGLRLSEQVLGPWLRSGVWVEPLTEAIDRVQYVRGGVRELELRDLRADQWLPRTIPATQTAMKRAIGNVADKGRQAFYESLVASTGWGFLGSIEPGARVVGGRPAGPIRDAFLLLDAGKIPRFDLVD